MANAEKFAAPVRRLSILSVALVAQMGLFYGAARHENPPEIAPLAGIAQQVDGWQAVRDYPMEQVIEDLLRADDTISRLYTDPGTGETASLFVAFFRTQRTGQTPHSPKNCLPGSGFEPVESGVMDVPVPGHGPVRINRFLVARGEDRSLVLYWYQSRGRTIADEFAAKFWLVADSIRYRRSDTALVRVVVPIAGEDHAAADRAGRRFVQTFYPLLIRALEPVS
jgi:EpsI family protein